MLISCEKLGLGPVQRLRASPEAGEELAERAGFKKPAPGDRADRSANLRSSDCLASRKREAGVAGYYVGMPSRSDNSKRFPLATVPHEPFFSRYSVPRTVSAAERTLVPARSELALAPRESGSFGKPASFRTGL